MHVMPTTENSNDIITHEDDFNGMESDRRVRNPWCIIDTANEFAMRFRNRIFDGIYHKIHNKNQLKKYSCKFLKEEFKYPYHIEVYPRKFYVGHGKNMVKGTLVAL